MRIYRPVSAAVFAIALSALVGGFFGGRVLATQDGLPERYSAFTAALNAIEARYVEPVPSDRVVYSAITGMLQTLDPHSSFMDPKQYAQMRERQEGRYYGLGISINVVDGNITVMSLFEGSPAYKKGIRRGDTIAKIAGEDAKGWTSDQAVQKLRGPRGTPVQISVRRAGYDRLTDIEVVRDEISIPSVPAYFMVSADTGYVQLHDFAENTDRELSRALRELSGQGMRRVLLDLRGNPGGPLGSGHQSVEPVPAEGRPDRLHARQGAQFRPGLSGGRGERVHQPSAGRADEPRQRERLGDRRRCAAGSRSRARRGRDHVREGARAVHLPREPGRGARIDHRAVLPRPAAA